MAFLSLVDEMLDEDLRNLARPSTGDEEAKDFNPDQPRIPAGKPGAGRWGVINAIFGHSTSPSKLITDDPEEAAKALAQGREVELQSVREVSALLERLAAIAADARAKGEKAPNYDLCKVTVPGSNLFCVNSKGIPRVEMPQLGGFPTPGSRADDPALKAPNGGVDLNVQFREHLLSKGYSVEDVRERASHLKVTQDELDGAKTAEIMKSMETRGIDQSVPLFVSEDNYIIDGHHRWAGAVGVDIADGVEGDNIDLNVERVRGLDVISLLKEANDFAADWGIPQSALGDFGHKSAEPCCADCAETKDFNPNQPRIPKGKPGAGRWGVVSAILGGAKHGVDNFGNVDYPRTGTMAKYRDANGNWTPERLALHQKIIDETLSDCLIDPKPTIFMLGGGTASGKTTLVNEGISGLPNPEQAGLINADELKPKLPEYDQMVAAGDPNASSFVHDESAYLAKLILAQAMERKFDLIYDGLGDSGLSTLSARVAAMKVHGHKIKAVYATVPTEMALARAEARGRRTGRFVPPSVVRGAHAAVSRVFGPAVRAGVFDEADLYDTRANAPNLIATYRNGKLKILDDTLWNEFEAKGNEE